MPGSDACSSSASAGAPASSSETSSALSIGFDISGEGERKNLFRESTYHYEEIAQIGNGAYGTVWKARDLQREGKFVALKKVRVPLSEDGVPMSTLREIGLLKQVDQHEHPNIVRLEDICHGPRLDKEHQLTLYLVFEHVEQDLATYIERCPAPGLSPDKIKDLMFQILCGVDFLHSHRIVHRDLKPQNILVTSDGKVKLADFGLAKTYDFDMRLTSVVVTLWYRSPEVLLGMPYATPVDLWSCGCILAEMYRRSPLFCGTSEADQLERIFHVIGTPQESEWPESVSISWHSFRPRAGINLEHLVPELCPDAKHLLQQMLVFTPHLRVCAADALEHPYFRNSGLVPPAIQQLGGSMATSGHLSPDSAALFLTASTSDDSGQSADSQPEM